MSSSTTSAGTTTYAYYPDGRLQSRTPSDPVSVPVTPGTTTFGVDAASNRVSAAAGLVQRTYGYDAAGNTLSDSTASFVYDDAGRRVEATAGGVTTSYAYNGLGARVKKTDGTTTVYFAYDESGHLVGEYDGSGGLIQETVWFGEVPVATLRPDGSGGIEVYYVHADHLNTPRKITRPSDGVIVWRWDSEPYGATPAEEDPDGDGDSFTYHLRFPGQYLDQETGLHYNYFRDYDPVSGRYVESDPIGLAGGPNSFLYANGNPLRYVDRDGLLFGLNFGESFGDSAAQYWADRQIQTGNPLYAIPGMFAVLWTPCTSDNTFSVLSIAAGGSSLIRTAGREWSHALPDRWFRVSSAEYKSWLPRWLNGPLNGNYRTALEHALNDPFGARFFGKEFMENELNPLLLRMWNRLPDWTKGAGLAAAAQATKDDCACDH